MNRRRKGCLSRGSKRLDRITITEGIIFHNADGTNQSDQLMNLFLLFNYELIQVKISYRKYTYSRLTKDCIRWLAITSTLSGCSPDYNDHAAHAPNALTVNCSAIFSSWNECFTEARRVCGTAHYSIVERADKAAEDGTSNLMGIDPVGLNMRNVILVCDPPL